MDLLTALLALLTNAAIVAAVIAYMGKAFVSQLQARDLEHYKHQLGALRFEQQTRFSWAHQQQAKVIGEVYGKLADTHEKMVQMMNPVQFGQVDREAQRQAAVKAYDALIDCFIPNRIFLSETRSEEVEGIITTMRTAFNRFSFAQGQQGELASMAWKEPWSHISEQVPAVLKALRREWRGVLGIAE